MDEVHTIYSSMEYGCVNAANTNKRAAKREREARERWNSGWANVYERQRKWERKMFFKMCSEVQCRECTLHRKQRHPYIARYVCVCVHRMHICHCHWIVQWVVIWNHFNPLIFFTHGTGNMQFRPEFTSSQSRLFVPDHPAAAHSLGHSVYICS